MPWEAMLVMLLTLLSLSRSTTRIRTVLSGMLIIATKKPIARQAAHIAIRKAFRETPRPTNSQ